MPSRQSQNQETLSGLLAHAIVAFARDFESAGEEGIPSLVALSNVLRVIDDGVDYKALPALSRMSLRAVRISTTYLEDDGWLTIEQNEKRGPKMVLLTTAGRKARDAGRARLELTDQRWKDRFGEKQIKDLCAALRAVVQQIDVELPHYPTGYGQGDSSMTGGSYIAAEPGPPRIPGHGEEWPVVIREDPGSVSGLSLTALISQVLTAFTIDYDEDVESAFGGLQGAVTFFRHVGDEGISLAEASQLGDVTGTGRSNLERHELVIVEPGSRKDGQRLVSLTSRGQRVRDRYPTRVAEIEQRWRSRYTKSVIDELRRSLEVLDGQFGGDLPDFPDTNGWLRRPRSR